MKRWGLLLALAATSASALGVPPNSLLAVDGLNAALELTTPPWVSEGAGTWRLNHEPVLRIQGLGPEADLADTSLSAAFGRLPNGIVSVLRFVKNGTFVGMIGLGIRAKGVQAGLFAVVPTQEGITVTWANGSVRVARGASTTVTADGTEWRIALSALHLGRGVDQPPLAADFWLWRLSSPDNSRE